jgi:hypothetical protein
VRIQKLPRAQQKEVYAILKRSFPEELIADDVSSRVFPGRAIFTISYKTRILILTSRLPALATKFVDAAQYCVFLICPPPRMTDGELRSGVAELRFRPGTNFAMLHRDAST